MNLSGGEKVFILSNTMELKTSEVRITRIIVELIKTFLFLVIGKNLIIPVLNPSNANEEIKPTMAISEVAIPIS